VVPTVTADSSMLSEGDHPDGLFQSEPTGPVPCPSSPVPLPRDRPVDVLRPGVRLPRPIPAWQLNPFRICHDGFPAGATFTTRLTGPDGRVRVRRSEDLEFVFTNAMSLGTWRLEVTARGARRPATASVRVRAPGTPTMYQVADRAPGGSAGMVLQLAGFPAHGTVHPFLHGPGNGLPVPFRRPLPVAVTDGGGEATYVVRAEPADPPGTYGVWLREIDTRDLQFSYRR
jgi:hypothetical protein